ncbi:MAG TPA: MFS transporter [bacterium]|nr:MFS transporter [bacterium]
MTEVKEKSGFMGFKRNIYALGLVSLFTDISSEMAYPLIPDLMKAVGAGAAALGVVEGVAEATASVMKAVSGYVSDRFGKRKQPVFIGYLMSGLAKPLLGLAVSWPLILLIRFSDRMGKGIRTAPRDALLADSSPPDKMGAAFGLHRAMDTMGAVLGPALAYFLLHGMGVGLTSVFILAAVPAAIGLAVIGAGVKEVPPRRAKSGPFRFSFKDLSPGLKRFILVSGLFSLGNFPAVFLILRCRELGIDTDHVILIYLLNNLVYSLTSLPAGALSDRIGRKAMLTAAYLMFAAVFAAGAMAATPLHAVIVFMGYGVFQGIYEGSSRALLADLEPSERRASSYGVLHAVIGMAMLPGGIMAGALWKFAGAPAAFGLSAAIGVAAAVLFVVLVSPPAAPATEKNIAPPEQ